jgi:hypothetical protein
VRRGNYDALPKWAREAWENEVKVLKMDLEAVTKVAFAVTTSETEQLPISNTEVAQSYGEPSRYLPPDTSVRFHVGGGWIDVRVQKDLHTDGIQIHGYTTLRIEPSSSNRLQMELQPR